MAVVLTINIVSNGKIDWASSEDVTCFQSLLENETKYETT